MRAPSGQNGIYRSARRTAESHHLLRILLRATHFSARLVGNSVSKMQRSAGARCFLPSWCGEIIARFRLNLFSTTCPANSSQDPNAQQQTRCNSATCGSLLSHPPDSLYIQCPKCDNTMNSREEPRQGFVGGVLTAAQGQKVVAKKRKDPAAPRAPMNAYMLFCKERRPAVSEQNPELPFGQVGSRLGETWRSMSAAEKKVCVLLIDC